MPFQLCNFASSTLSAAIGPTTTTISISDTLSSVFVNPAGGALSLSPTNQLPLVLESVTGDK